MNQYVLSDLGNLHSPIHKLLSILEQNQRKEPYEVYGSLDSLIQKLGDFSDIQQALEYLNQKREKLLSSYPSPTTYYFEEIDLGQRIQKTIDDFIAHSKNDEYKRWWKEQLLNKNVEAHNCRYIPMILNNTNTTLYNDPKFNQP